MVVGKLGGPLGWLATQLLKYGGNYIINWITWFVDKITKKAERDKKNEEAIKKYEEIIKNPESTLEERAKAYEDLVNRDKPSDPS